MKNLYRDLPETPGVYLMKNKAKELLYIGKAGNLRRRVSSYFLRPQDYRIERLVKEIHSVDYKKTDTAIEALILEASLIKKYQPPFNIREKDDKSFLYVNITKDKFPRVILARGKDIESAKGKLFGPFTSASSIREALRILRKIFPWNTHSSQERILKECFDYQIGLCPGVCVGAVSRVAYLKTIRNIVLFFEGKKEKILKSLKREMRAASKRLEFEQAQKLRHQIFNLEHIQDVALIAENKLSVQDAGEQDSLFRIEGYDISNISGTSPVGSMVVFVDGKPDKKEYRKFKIKSVQGINDVAMLKEMLARRFQNSWALPDLVLIDGGLPQVNGAREILSGLNLQIPIMGIAKGPERKRNDFIGTLSPSLDREMLIRVRDEAHRFAISYHKKLRGSELFR